MGQPFTIGKSVCHGEGRDFQQVEIMTRAEAVAAFREMLAIYPRNYPALSEILEHLRGRDLACWCPIDQPCHADVLLEVANG